MARAIFSRLGAHGFWVETCGSGSESVERCSISVPTCVKDQVPNRYRDRALDAIQPCSSTGCSLRWKTRASNTEAQMNNVRPFLESTPINGAF